MSVQIRKLTGIRSHLRRVRQKEGAERRRWAKAGLTLGRWVLMLQHEFIRDDVRVRAESLAFLMVFSLLPLVAGCFFLFSFFTQFGMVQDALLDVVNRFLSTIPEGHRGFVQDYVLRFKDAYLSTLHQKSGSIGIFALFILIWVGLQTFRNVDKTLNHIWSADRTRPFFEQVRNFLVVAVASPLVLIAALSIPLILKRTVGGQVLLESVPMMAWMMNNFLMPSLVFGTFSLVYRFVPVRRVRWRSALAGAGFATVALLLANYLVEVYFRIGTQSAYGKAAVVPIIGFWIYVVWIIVILGAEVSYLYQNGRDLLRAAEWEPSLREGEGMLAALVELQRAHVEGTNPVPFDRLRDLTALDTGRLMGLLEYLGRRGLVLECSVSGSSLEGAYALGKDLGEVDVGALLAEFFSLREGDTSVRRFWNEAISEWAAGFTGLRVADLTSGRKKNRK